MNYISIGTKGSNYNGKYGKLHLSKDKWLVENSAFMIPKASPLYASIIWNSKVYFFDSHNISA